MSQSDICFWFNTLTQQLRKNSQRSLIVLQGDSAWASEVSATFIQQLSQNATCDNSIRVITYGEAFIDVNSDVIANFRQQLGRENDVVLFNDPDFHPDAFAALSGTIVAGGVMIWHCSKAQALDSENLFLQRILTKAKNDRFSFALSQTDNDLPVIVERQEISEIQYKSAQELNFSPRENGCKTFQQQCAVNAIEKVALGHRKRPLLLTADRGRGKSSALAIAVAKLIGIENASKASQKIIITAPHSNALAIFFQQLQQSCPEGELSQNTFVFNRHCIEFIAVDVLIKEKPKADLLLIDEAAAIPVYILSQLVDSYHRAVFSSTQHGYEGAGRGFAVKFTQLLTEKTPHFNQYHIHQPIRWAENDPLESFVFDAFLLKSNNVESSFTAILSTENKCTENKNVRSASLENKNMDKKSLEQSTQAHSKNDHVMFRRIEQQQLIADEGLLQQIFSVLVTAHYQTSPSDLKLLLNNKALRLFVLTINQQIVAVALTLKEGNAEKHEINQVANAKRRLKNQFLPQSLFLHNHCTEAFDYHYLRVMRIAVLPSIQQQGLGIKLLSHIKQYAEQNSIDLLGTSFGANESLLSFWHKAHYSLVRLGFSVDKASGEHSSMYLQPLNAKAVYLVTELQKQFYCSFTYLLTEQYQPIPAQVIISIIKQWPAESLPVLTDFDQQVIEDFIARKSLFDNCSYSLHLQLIHFLATYSNNISQKNTENHRLIEVLVKRLLQKQSIESICQEFALTGKKQLNNTVIDGVSYLFQKAHT
ncbi:GNAT family N-acetyltransferase [Colwellia sp. 1_MG-2023]|uniref:GNAT family N-acetyltransferase n=1 Tax=Colwellia sp. 1_MG-2023 TaxID=3062649 RepID=UPI0026E35909|nr:GNAT family N-acetyltransferase [Colwellia sp. 1_MG-2023]MDO6446368.1 GNAT family N-acetyltransferase [Colwellia sp. 1_MG-2023]